MDLSELARRLRRGLLTGHEDMPMFRFKRDDADAMAAYIRSIRGSLIPKLRNFDLCCPTLCWAHRVENANQIKGPGRV